MKLWGAGRSLCYSYSINPIQAQCKEGVPFSGSVTECWRGTTRRCEPRSSEFGAVAYKERRRKPPFRHTDLIPSYSSNCKLHFTV